MPFFSRIKRGFGFNRGIDEPVTTNPGEEVPIATNGTVTVDCNIMTMHPPSPLGKENNFNCIENAKSTLVPKKTMEASELLAKHAGGRGGTKSPSTANSQDDGAATLRGRKGSDMKYSSISPPMRRVRVPSAKTISDQCFPNRDSSSTSSPESSSLGSYDEQFESYTLDENEASPESRAIMEEMEQIYQSSPMPESYLKSPPKKLQVLPEIVLRPKQTPVSEKGAVAKKNMDASELLVKQGEAPSKDGGAEISGLANGPSTTRIAEAKAAYGGPRRNSSIPRQLSSAEEDIGKSKGTDMNSYRRNSSAPNDSRGISESCDWDMPSEKGTRSAGTAKSATTTTATTTTTINNQSINQSTLCCTAGHAPWARGSWRTRRRGARATPRRSTRAAPACATARSRAGTRTCWRASIKYVRHANQQNQLVLLLLLLLLLLLFCTVLSLSLWRSLAPLNLAAPSGAVVSRTHSTTASKRPSIHPPAARPHARTQEKSSSSMRESKSKAGTSEAKSSGGGGGDSKHDEARGGK